MKLTFFETETKGMQTTKQQKVIKTTKGYQNNKRLSKQQKVIKTTKGYQNNKRLSKQQICKQTITQLLHIILDATVKIITSEQTFFCLKPMIVI